MLDSKLDDSEWWELMLKLTKLEMNLKSEREKLNEEI